MNETQQFPAIDAQKLEQAWIDAGKKPEWIARFLRKFPAGFYLQFVKDELWKWGARGDTDNYKLLTRGKGQRKFDIGITSLERDFAIYKRVLKKQLDGFATLTGDKGAFMAVSSEIFMAWEQVRDRYFRFINHTPINFVDNGKLIFGPGKVDFNGNFIICIAEWKPEHGFKIIS